MPIVSSVVVSTRRLANGVVVNRERHTDHLGQQRDIEALASDANLAARITIVIGWLAREELAEDLRSIYAAGDQAVVTTNHVTIAEVRDALREAYRTATREQACALGAFLNTLTNNQLGTLFGVSGAALTSLRTRLQAKASQWTALVAAVGE